MNIYNRIGRLGWFSLLEGTDRQGAADTWFVDGNNGAAANNANSGQGESWSAPFATLNYAISRCANDASNIIFVAADHTENLSTLETVSGTTTTGVCVDKSGITIIGVGLSDRRPTFTMTAAAGSFNVLASECAIYNLLLVSNFADVATLIAAGSGGDGLLVENCEFRDSSAITEHKLAISIAANCDDTVIRGCSFRTTDTASATEAAIRYVGAHYRSVIQDCVFRGDWGGASSDAVIDASASAGFDLLIVDNIINNMDLTYGAGIEVHASTTGAVVRNDVFSLAVAAPGITALGCLRSGNKVTSYIAADAKEPGSSSTSAGGNHFYVDSGTGSASNTGLSWDDPLSLVDDGIGKCTASNGDIVHVAAGHAESDMDGTAGQIFDVDVIGVTILGEGIGDARPTFTFTTNATNALVDVTVANCRLENLIFKCNIASQENMIKLATSADGTQIVNCEFLEGGQTPLTCIMLGGGDGQADNVLIEGNRFYMPTDGNQDNAVEVLFDMTGLVIKENYIHVNSDEASIEFPAGGNASQDIQIIGNTIINEQTGIHCIEIEQTALTVTGVIANNLLVNDTRGACLQPNIANCYGNVWMPSGGNVRPVLLEGGDITTPGQNIYVNSAHTQAVDDTAHGTSWDFPLATIEYANTNVVTASNNDVIHVGPGHEETISDSLFLDFDSAGVTCVGYGNGDDRPKVTFDHVDAVVDIGAASVTLKNLVFRASLDVVVVGVDILAGFNQCKIIDCDFGPSEAASDEFAIALQVNAACDYTVISGCRFFAGAQAAVTAIKFTGANAYLVMHNNQVTGAYSGPPILGSGAAITDCDIYNNRLQADNAVDTFNLVAASTGFVRHNWIVVGAATFAADLDIGNCWNLDNLMIANDDVGGAKCDNRYTVAASVTETQDG